MWIQLPKMMRIHANPDPQPCLAYQLLKAGWWGGMTVPVWQWNRFTLCSLILGLYKQTTSRNRKYDDDLSYTPLGFSLPHAANADKDQLGRNKEFT